MAVDAVERLKVVSQFLAMNENGPH